MMLYTKLHMVQSLYILFFIKHRVDRYIRIYDETKYLTLFNSNEKFDRVFDWVRYLIMLKSNISDFYSHKFMKIKINSDDD